MENPVDFALWKAAKLWWRFLGTVPWGGAGSFRLTHRVFSLSTEILGDTIDIHGGGADLGFLTNQ